MSTMSPYASGRRAVRSVAALGALLLAGALLTAPGQATAADGLSLSGHVDQEGAGPASGATVILWGNDGLQHGSMQTDAVGAYSFTGLTPGLYQLQFLPPAAAPYAPVWLDDAPVRQFSPYLELNGASLGGLDATLPEESVISGTVTYDASVPSEKRTATVHAFRYNQPLGMFEAAGGPAAAEEDGTYRIGGLSEGEYAVRVTGARFDDLATVYWDDEEFVWASDAVSLNAGEAEDAIDFAGLTTSARSWERLGGSDRFATAVAISQAAFPDPEIDTVWIANGLNFPDALSAGPAAAMDGAPLLLVRPDSIPDGVLAELLRLNPDDIVVVGGTGAVSQAVFNQLDALAGDGAYRIGGADRYETSRNIVSEVFGEDWVPTVTVADGRNFPDALAAGPASSAFHGPVLLVNGAASVVDPPTEQLLDDLDAVSITIAGGSGVISTRLENSLRSAADVVEVIRSAGADRYGTADALNRRVFPNADAVFLATGAGFADALAGSAVAALTTSPLFLVQKNCIPQEVMTTIAELRPTYIVLLGGTGVLGSGIENLAICGGGFGTDLMVRSDASLPWERDTSGNSFGDLARQDSFFGGR